LDADFGNEGRRTMTPEGGDLSFQLKLDDRVLATTKRRISQYISFSVDRNFVFVFAIDFWTRIYIRLGNMYFLILFCDVRVRPGIGIVPIRRLVGNSSEERGLGTLSWPLSG
jgi:hypothetical protein